MSGPAGWMLQRIASQSCGADLEAGDLDVHVIVQVQSGGSLDLGLGLIQGALHGHMRGPGAVKVLVQGEHVEAAQHLVVERRHLPRQPAGQISRYSAVAA